MKWDVKDAHPSRAVLIVVDETGYPLASIFTTPDDEMVEIDGIWQNDQQRILNAKLMAAAPELLGALLLARDMIEANRLDIPNTLGKINAAIEKAIGVKS